MHLDRYLSAVDADLAKVTALAADDVRATAERLVSALDPALRLALVQAVTDAAAEISAELHDAVAVVHLQDREPVITVRRTAPVPDEPAAVPAVDDDEGTARLTVRLPESVKRAAEERAGRSGQSLNTWMVQAIRQATADPGRRGPSRRITGWA